MEKFLAAFDFDHTIIHENSDYIARDLLPKEALKRATSSKNTRGWTEYMDDIFKLLHEEGVTIKKLRDVIIKLPPVPDFVKLIKDLKTINVDIIIISDANTYFIDEWLKSRQIRDAVQTIYSNPGHINGERLSITKFHEQDWCNLSTRNLCKGFILQSHIEKQKAEGVNYTRVFYVGDGHNDLCPTLKLSDQDYVFPRFGYPLLKEIRRSPNQIKASVVPWDHTKQIWSVIKQLRPPRV